MAIERLLAVTENPRHRFLLRAYYRHRYLEIAGCYEEIFAPEMMVEHPVYHFDAVGINTTLEGQDAIRSVSTTAIAGFCSRAAKPSCGVLAVSQSRTCWAYAGRPGCSGSKTQGGNRERHV